MPPVLEFLNLRTFSSVWYWIAVGVVWAVVSHRPMGVPYDMVWRARQRDSEARAALDAVARTLARRQVRTMARAGTVVVAIYSATLTTLLLLAVVYRLELAQGALLLALPLSLVGWLGHLTARSIDRGGDSVRHLRRLRIATNGVGLIALFVTAFWGMYVNLMVSVL